MRDLARRRKARGRAITPKSGSKPAPGNRCPPKPRYTRFPTLDRAPPRKGRLGSGARLGSGRPRPTPPGNGPSPPRQPAALESRLRRSPSPAGRHRLATRRQPVVVPSADEPSPGRGRHHREPVDSRPCAALRRGFPSPPVWSTGARAPLAPRSSNWALHVALPPKQDEHTSISIPSLMLHLPGAGKTPLWSPTGPQTITPAPTASRCRDRVSAQLARERDTHPPGSVREAGLKAEPWRHQMKRGRRLSKRQRLALPAAR